MSIYKDLEDKRIELYQKYKKENNISFIFYGIAAIGMLVIILNMSNYSNSPMTMFFVIIMIISIITGSVFSSKAHKFRQKFSAIVKNEFVDKLLNEHFEQSSFSEKAHVSLEKINSAGLIKKPDRFKGEDLISGTYKNISFNVSDVNLIERQEVRTKNGTHVTYVTYFKGRWFVYKLPKSFNHIIKIIERNNGANLRGLKKFETEMIEFNKKFSIYSSDEQFFFYIMNAFLIERLLQLENEHRGSIYYCFKDDELHIGINDGSDSLSIDFKREINERSISHFVDDIVLIKKIIDGLRLDDVKFR